MRINRMVGRWHLHGSVQNLNDDDMKSWRHGRGWIFFRNWNPDKAETRPEHTGQKVVSGQLGAEWSIPDRHPGLGFTWGGANAEDDWNLSIGLGLFHLYLSVEGLRKHGSKYQKDAEGHYIGDREISIRFFDKAVWWMLWMDGDEWSSTDPKWRRGAWHPLDTLLGSTKYASREIRTLQVTIPMPERSYPATVKLTEDTWKRPRAWWTSARIRRARIEVEGGIPHPGKGENSYDCDEDATYSLTTQARDEAEAIGAMVETVMRSRRRYGGADWRPAANQVTQ
jgi:hypothetical protein